jgi:hypothetical protein
LRRVTDKYSSSVGAAETLKQQLKQGDADSEERRGCRAGGKTKDAQKRNDESQTVDLMPA